MALEHEVNGIKFALDDEAMLGKWREVSRYHCWVQRYPVEAPPLSVLRARDEGVFRLPIRNRSIQFLAAGQPFHIEHLFGYWRVSDADVLYLRISHEDVFYYVLLVGGTTAPHDEDTVLWICPKCASRLSVETFPTRKKGWDAFWDAEIETVRRFNDDRGLRLCAKCGHVHPPVAYGFFPEADREDESAARAEW